MHERKVKKALDTCFSGLVLTPGDKSTILKIAKGEKIMKKKLSLGLALAILLVFLAAAALAVAVWHAYVEDIIATEAEKGYFDTWALEDKLRMIEKMGESGVELPGEKMAALKDPALTDTEKDIIATEIITDRYGREDAISHFSVMEKEIGRYGTWPLEVKAWYTKQLEKYGRLGADEERNLLPEPGDVQEKEALQTAKTAILSAYGLQENDLDDYTADVYFREYPQRPGFRFWIFEFHPPVGTGRSSIVDYYAAVAADTGELVADELLGFRTPAQQVAAAAPTALDEEINALRAQKGEAYQWTHEERARYFPSSYGLPGPEDIPQEEAAKMAGEAILQRMEMTEASLAPYKPYALYAIGDFFTPSPVWMVHYILEDEQGGSQDIITVYLDPKSGEVLQLDSGANG